MAAARGVSPPVHGPVELVPSVRGGTKAKYGGRTFTLETNNGMRYRWRCDVRPCRSRLTTDAYGKEHMVYAFRNHDEDVHRREAARKKRRSEATYKQAVTKIGDYGYVLENQVGSVLFWRCEYVSCPGRCRTTAELCLVAGPSFHITELHNQGGQPDTVGHASNLSIAMELDRSDSNESHPPDATEGVQSNTRLISFYRQQRQLQEKYRNLTQPKKEVEGRQEEQCKGRTCITETVKQEPASELDQAPPLPPAAHDVGDIVTSKYSETKHRPDTWRSSSSNGQIPDGRPALDSDIVVSCPSQSAAQPSEAPAAVYDTDCVALSDSEAEDKDEAVDMNLAAGADIVEAHEKLSYKGADGFLFDGSHVTSSGNRRLRCAEVLEVTSGGDGDSRERDLRAGVLDQMRRLLEAETCLARERLQTEVLRGSLLRRTLGGVVVKKEPDWSMM